MKLFFTVTFLCSLYALASDTIKVKRVEIHTKSGHFAKDLILKSSTVRFDVYSTSLYFDIGGYSNDEFVTFVGPVPQKVIRKSFSEMKYRIDVLGTQIDTLNEDAFLNMLDKCDFLIRNFKFNDSVLIKKFLMPLDSLNEDFLLSIDRLAYLSMKELLKFSFNTEIAAPKNNVSIHFDNKNYVVIDDIKYKMKSCFKKPKNVKTIKYLDTEIGNYGLFLDLEKGICYVG